MHLTNKFLKRGGILTMDWYNATALPLKSLSAMDTPMYFHNETREVHEMLATMELGIKVSDVFVDTMYHTI